MIATETKLQFEIDIQHDSFSDCPLREEDDFQLTTFRMGTQFDGEYPADLDDAEANQTWWIVSCYRHSGSHWFISGQPGPVCQWDTTRVAGVLRFTGKRKYYPDLLKTANAVIADFNAWANGECYGFKLRYQVETLGPCPTCHCGTAVPDRSWHDLEDHGGYGYIGDDSLVSGVIETLTHLQTAMPELTPERYEIRLTGTKYLNYLRDEIRDKVQALGFTVVN